jgi:hypothetical protein
MSDNALSADAMQSHTMSPDLYPTELMSTPTSATSDCFRDLSPAYTNLTAIDDSTPSPLPLCTPEAYELFPLMLIYDPPPTCFPTIPPTGDITAAEQQSQQYAASSEIWAPHIPVPQETEATFVSFGGALDL